jgi:hypothetical protein
MRKDVWIARISDYRKFCIRIYVELYKKNDLHMTVYYDVLKESWHYQNRSPEAVINFDELQELVKEYTIKDLQHDHSYSR